MKRAARRGSAPRAERAEPELLGPLRALLETLAPGRVRSERIGRGAVRFVIRGKGKRRLPGRRVDAREHTITVAFDGSFLQLGFRVDGTLRDSRLLSLPRTGDLRHVEEFVESALSRMRIP